jgi:hypothetical protein
MLNSFMSLSCLCEERPFSSLAPPVRAGVRQSNLQISRKSPSMRFTQLTGDYFDGRIPSRNDMGKYKANPHFHHPYFHHLFQNRLAQTSLQNLHIKLPKAVQMKITLWAL